MRLETSKARLRTEWHDAGADGNFQVPPTNTNAKAMRSFSAILGESCGARGVNGDTRSVAERAAFCCLT